MPRIPVYEQTTTPSGLIQGGKISSAYAPSPVGKAISALGEAGAQMVKAFDHQDALVAEENLNKLREEQSRLALDEKDGYLNKRGKDAIERDKDGKTLQEQYIGKFDSYKQQLTAGMTENQIAKFSQKARLLDLDLKQSVLKHTINEADKYADDVFKNGIKTEQDIVGRDYNNPVAFKVSLERITQNVNAYADRKGLSDEQRSVLLREQTSALHASVLTGALAKTDMRFADTYYKSVSADLGAEDSLKFKNFIESEKDRIKARSEKYNEGEIWKMFMDGKNDLDIFNSQAFAGLEPKAKMQIMSTISNARNVRADITPEIYSKVWALSSNPQELAKMTDQQIYAMTPEIGEKFVKQLLIKKVDFAKNPDAITVDSDQFKTIAKQYNITGKKELVEVEYKVKTLIDQEQQDRGRKLTFAEKDKLMREAFVKIPVDVEGKWFTQNVRLYDLANIKEKSKIAISGSDRKTIVDSLSKAGIENPSEAQILRAYIELKKK